MKKGFWVLIFGFLILSLFGVGFGSENNKNYFCDPYSYCVYKVDKQGVVSLVEKGYFPGKEEESETARILSEIEKEKKEKKLLEKEESLVIEEEPLSRIIDAASPKSTSKCGSIPTDRCYINSDTTFKQGIYYLPSGILIKQDSNNPITLDCNGSILIGNKSSKGINIIRYKSVSKSIIIKNCVIRNYSKGISAESFINGFPEKKDISLFNNIIEDINYYGIGIYRTNGSQIKNNSIKNCGRDGIYFSSSDHITFTNNLVINCTEKGFYIRSSDNLVLINNTAKDNEYGFYLTNSGPFSTKLINNKAINNEKYGFYVFIYPYTKDKLIETDLVGNIAEDNSFELINLRNSKLKDNVGTGGGFYVYNSENLEITNNTILKHEGSGFYLDGVDLSYIEDNEAFDTTAEFPLVMTGFMISNCKHNTFVSNYVRNYSNGFQIGESENNTLIGNEVVNSNIGIFINNYSINNILKNNRFCGSNDEDFSIYNINKNDNFGYDNACDKPGDLIWMWNDEGTTGCSYACSNEDCDKLEPASKKGFNLLNYSDNNWRVDFLDWIRDSKHSEYAYHPLDEFINEADNMSYESSVEYELDVPPGKNKLKISYNYLISGGKENSINFSTEIFIYNFDTNRWENVYLDSRVPDGFPKEDIVDIYLSKRRINDGKIRLRVVQRNVDIFGDDGSWTSWRKGSEEWYGTISLDRFTYQFCSSDTTPPQLTLHPSLTYNPETNQLDIKVYAYNLETGQKVTSGYGSYRIYNGSLVIQGSLNYNNYEGLWRASKNIFLAPGNYEVEIDINGFVDTINFFVGENTARVYGFLKDENGNLLDGVNVSIYKSLKFQSGEIYASTLANKNYSFIVEPDSYILVAEKGEAKITTIAFSIEGGQELKKDLILTLGRENLKFVLEELKNNLEKKMDEETEKMAELTSLASVDLKEEESEIMTNLLFAGITKGEFGDWTGLIKEIVRGIFKRKSYERGLKILVNGTRQKILDVGNKGIGTFSWLMNFSEGFKERSKEELQSKEIYQNSLDSMNQIYNEIYFPSNENFDFSKARKIVGDQLNQLQGKDISENILLLPNPEKDKPIIWSFSDYYNSYLSNHKDIEGIKISKWVSLSIRIGASIVVGLISSPAGGIATYFALELLAQNVGLILNGVQIALEAEATKNYGFASAEWILDTKKIPFVFNETINYLKDEFEQPYYLHKDNQFDSEIEINLHPDRIENGKNLIYPGLDNLIVKNATIRLKNLKNKALTRVLAESRWERRKGREKIIDHLGYDSFSVNLNHGEEIEKDITYEGIDQQSIGRSALDPQVLIVEGFSGPFQTSLDKEHFFVLYFFPLTYMTTKTADSWQEIKNYKIPIRSEKKQLTVNDYVDYLPKIININKRNEGGERVRVLALQNLNTSKEIILNSKKPEFNFNYTVSNESYGVEFQLFYPLGTDVDLHVYYNNSHIGFNPETGEKEIEFPGVYSGKYERPEIIYIPQATNKTYEVKVS